MKILFFLILFSSASFSFRNLQLSGKKLVGTIGGKWCAVTSSEHPCLIFFTNGSVVVDNRIDTIYRLGYKMMSGGFVLFEGLDSKTYLNKVEKLNQDSLVFRDLLDEKGRLVYRRCD